MLKFLGVFFITIGIVKVGMYLVKKWGRKVPVGNPTKQTIATKKYKVKVGWISISYKLKKELVEEFAQACDEVGVSQAGQLSA